MHKVLAILLFALALPCGLLADGPEFGTNLSTTLDEAHDRGAPILIMFTHDGWVLSAKTEGVTLKSKELVKPLETWIPLRVRCGRNPNAHALARYEYMPEKCAHIALVFLDSNGEDIDFHLRKHNQVLTSTQLLALLNSALLKTATGLTRKEYGETFALFEKARKELESGKATRAMAKLKRLAVMKTECGLKHRAAVLLADTEDVSAFLFELMLTASKTGAIYIAEEIADYLKDFDSRLVSAINTHIIEPTPEDREHFDEEREQAYSDAFFAVLSRDYREAVLALSTLGLETKALVEQAERLSITGFSIDSVAIHSKGKQQVDHDLRVTFSTGAAAAQSVRIQYYFLTDKGRQFAGYEEFTDIEPLTTYRCAVAVSDELLKGERIVNTCAELYLYGEFVEARSMHASEERWWHKPNPEGVLFYSPGDSGWISPRLKVIASGSGYTTDQ